MSVETFYDGNSAGGAIDLAMFLDSSANMLPSKQHCGSSSKLDYVKVEQLDQHEGSTGSSDMSNDVKYSLLKEYSAGESSDTGVCCDVDCLDLSSPDCSGGLSLPLNDLSIHSF